LAVQLNLPPQIQRFGAAETTIARRRCPSFDGQMADGTDK
jgi:hypothetical protein